MITSKQIKAARALLDWSQDALAKKAGISLRALTNIESEIAVPRADTQLYLQQALERGGVEFLQGGVRLCAEVLEIYKYEGQEALHVIFTDVFRVLEKGGVLMGLSLDERYFQKHGAELMDDIYEEVHKRKIRERYLIRKGDTFLITAKSHYRWLRHELFTEIPFLVYGNTVLLILWEPNLRIILIRNQGLANAYKKQFETYWQKESEPLPDEF
jgi:transcriptional regulator with XRE-family HTH domain